MRKRDKILAFLLVIIIASAVIIAVRPENCKTTKVHRIVPLTQNMSAVRTANKQARQYAQGQGWKIKLVTVKFIAVEYYMQKGNKYKILKVGTMKTPFDDYKSVIYTEKDQEYTHP